MKITLALASCFLISGAVLAQSKFSGEFNRTNQIYQLKLRTDGAAEIQASSNLSDWSRIAETPGNATIDDPQSQKADFRFYRLKPAPGSPTNIIGFVKVKVPAGKMAAIVNPFAADMKLDTPASRIAFFGEASPKIEFKFPSGNNQFANYSFDPAKNAWAAGFPPLRNGVGTMIQSSGPEYLLVFTGDVPTGKLSYSVPKGQAFIGSRIPKSGNLEGVLGAKPKAGTQIFVWNTAAQAFRTTSFDTFGDGMWVPFQPEYTPGTAFHINSPEAATWSFNFEPQK